MFDQKGSSIIVFIIIILTLSSIIIGGSFYIKSALNDTKQAQTLQGNTSVPNNNQTQQLKTPQPVSVETTNSLEDKAVKRLIEAMKTSDYRTIYQLTSSAFTANTSIDSFVSNMQVQEKEIGKVESVEVLSKPEVTTNSQGIKSFSINSKITYNRNGAKETNTYKDTFIWESDQWKFWSSEQSR